MKRIIAIDPGTHCGYAVLHDGVVSYGVLNLAPGRYEGGGMRFLRFATHLRQMLPADAVFFEEVRRHLGTDAAHVYGGIVAVLTSICEELSIPYRAIPVGTIKKYATGKGNAGKPEMVAWAQRRWPDVVDDNIADALAILDCALATSGENVPLTSTMKTPTSEAVDA
jgi:Holliday junction resolvasome RuvABC endonuclease subunit